NTLGLNSSSNYTLRINQSPLTNVVISALHTGEIACESEFNLWQSNDKEHSVGMYKKTELDNEGGHNLAFQFLYSLGANYMFNLGVKNWSFAKNKCPCPELYSIGAMGNIIN